MSLNQPTRQGKSVLRWLASGIGLIILLVVAFILYEGRKTRLSIELAHERERQTTYQAKTFPASITFPERTGPVGPIEQAGLTTWRGSQYEAAEAYENGRCRDSAEFHLLSDPGPLLAQPFSDMTHPWIRKGLEHWYDADLEAVFEKAIVVREIEYEGWKIRTTLIPTPYGGAVLPSGLSRAHFAQLSGETVPSAPEKGEVQVDPRFRPTRNQRTGYSSGPDPRIAAEKRVELKYASDQKEFERLHLHVHLVEAVRDFGEGRVIILRRRGRVHWPELVSESESTLQAIAATVTVP